MIDVTGRSDNDVFQGRTHFFSRTMMLRQAQSIGKFGGVSFQITFGEKLRLLGRANFIHDGLRRGSWIIGS
jgi:hypothetical protein